MKFKLNIVDRDNIVPLALGVPMERSMAIAAAAGMDDKGKEILILEMLDACISQCETFEEAIAIAFMLGGFHEQEMTDRETLALIGKIVDKA